MPHVVWGADFDVYMRGAGAAGVAGGHDLLACCDGVAGGYGCLGAVAVGPYDAGVVGGGEADAAGVAVAAAGWCRSLGPTSRGARFGWW